MYAFGLDGLQLAAVDFINPKTRSLEGLIAADADGQFGHFALLVGLGAVEVGLEYGQEIFIFFFAVGGYQFNADFGFLAFFQCHFGLGQPLGAIA